MRDVELFRLALGLESPWDVERTEFDAARRRLDLYLDFRPGARFVCAECGAGECPAHDTTEKSWRHLNFFRHEAYLHARVPRVKCERCGVKLVEVPWALSSDTHFYAVGRHPVLRTRGSVRVVITSLGLG